MNDLERLIRKHIVYAYIIAALAVVTLIYWLLRGHAGNVRVGEKIDEIKTTTVQNERRVEIIFDRKEKEEALANEKITEKLRTVSDDDLPDLLAGLLSDYRRQNSGK